jgi:mannobiose 2-epimerase
MLSLAEYTRTFDKPQAAEYALNCFRSVDARFQDSEYFGYDETSVSNPDRAKNTGNIMHLIEAFTVLYEATGDAQVGERLNEFVKVTVDYILQPEGYCRMTFRRDWIPTGSPRILYGHDLQTAWLLLDAAEALGRKNDPKIVNAAFAMGSTSAEMAFDTDLGGYYHDGNPDGTVTRKTKIWWVQCEALLCLWRLYEITGSGNYLDKLDATLEFIEKYQRDPKTGEWFAGIEGESVTDWTFGLGKGTLRKASYHNVRALVNLDRWIGARLNLK